jgi:hypothetical protein
MDFDGTDDYISSSGPTGSITKNYTIEAWINTNNSPTGVRSITSFSGTMSLYLNTSNNTLVHWQAYNGYAACGYWINFLNVSSGDWHYVVSQFTYNESTKVYVDASEPIIDTTRDTTSADCLNSSPNLSGEFLIGRYYDARNYFKGKIDDIKIYNEILSETAIKQNYLSGLNNLYAKGLITELEYNEKLSEL